ncbi:MAG: penicillin acylase family protein [Desulfobacterales bacterium]|nr:penicillin acylase family protein [Desulfobacterales bacterium]
MDSWKDPGKRKKAQLALDMLRDFDGDMQAGSSGAALVGVLLDCATKNIFLDELGPEDSRAMEVFPGHE